jgi:cell wall-associated NlpC family hydrolase
MNELVSRTESRESTRVTVIDDGEGNLIETTEPATLTFLYITSTPKTADEMATQYGFNDQQRAQLAELLDQRYDCMWSAVLYGIHNGSGDIVEVAASQIGNTGGQPYWSWYGFSSRVEWCACFVSWCANECGYIEAGIIPKFAGCEWQGEAWFKERGQWQERGYTPKPGDIIFFDWDGDDVSDHVGIWILRRVGTTIPRIVVPAFQ